MTTGSDQDPNQNTPGNEAVFVAPPQSLFQLLFMMVGGTVRSLTRDFPRGLIPHLLRLVAFSLVILAVNTFLVVYVNEGFTPTRSNPWVDITSLRAPKETAHLFWSIAAIMLASTFGRIRTYGILRFMGDLVGFPLWLLTCVRSSGQSWLAALLFGAAVALVAGIFVRSMHLSLLLAAFLALSFSAQVRSHLLLVVALGISDLKRLLRPVIKNPGPIHLAPIALGIFGAAVGLALSAFLPFDTTGNVIASIALAVIVILLKFRVLSSRTASVVLGLALFHVLFSQTTGVSADDGGWREGGSSLQTWVESPGALTAVEEGASTSLLGGLAAMFGSIGWGALQNGIGAAVDFLTKVPGSTGLAITPVGPGPIDVATYGREIMNAGSPEAAQRAAAMGIWRRFLPPGLSGRMERYTGSVLDFPNTDPGAPRGSSGGAGGSGGSGSSRPTTPTERKAPKLPDFEE